MVCFKSVDRSSVKVCSVECAAYFDRWDLYLFCVLMCRSKSNFHCNEVLISMLLKVLCYVLINLSAFALVSSVEIGGETRVIGGVPQ